MTTTDNDGWSVMRVLSWTTARFQREGLASPRLDAELLLAHCLGVERVRLYIDHDKPLQSGELARFRAVIQRRLDREPVAYITGTREFWSLELAVGRGVLIPRPETETLVERALELVDSLGGGAPVVVDVGTGSGAVAVALAKERPELRVVASDVDPDALAVAAENARSHGVEIEIHEGDLLDAIPTELSPRLVVANLPYVESGELDELQPEIARWEPRGALDGGEDGLRLIRRLVDQVHRRRAAIALEIGCRQGAAVRRLLEERGFEEVALHQDLGGLDRVVTGVVP